MSLTIIQMSVQQLVCTGCGAEANANCSCGVSYIAKSAIAAKAVLENPNKSDRAIAADLGVAHTTIKRARAQVEHNVPPDEADETDKRIGRDGKSYSARQRVVDDPDIPASHQAAADVTSRRRIFMRTASAVMHKAELGAGLKFAKGAEIDDEILMTLREVIRMWSDLYDEILARKGD